MPATGPRTSSLSSNASAVDPSKKKFACLFEGCLKSFSRSEHLHRHSLNHKDGANTCTRCSAHFRRRDLLDRHMVRHKEKDDEAGGEGLGHLATRKRLWKDADGNIITGRRPFQAPMPKKIVNTDLAIATRDTIASNERNLHSVSGPRRIPGRARVRHVNRKEPPPEPIHTEESIQIAEGDQLEFPEMNSWAMQMDENNFTNNNHNYENIKQEPGFSYNSPFTTMNYYSWLFENDQFNNTDSNAQSPTHIGREGPFLETSSNHSSNYASSSDSYSECLSPTSLNPSLLSRRNSFSMDAFLPLSILADGAATMRRHTFAENLTPSLVNSPPPQQEPLRRESHCTNFPSRLQKPFFDYDGSSLFSDSALPEMYYSRGPSTASSSRISSPLPTPHTPDLMFSSYLEKKYQDGSEALSRHVGQSSLTELMGI